MLSFPYSKVLRQAYELARGNFNLWWFGAAPIIGKGALIWSAQKFANKEFPQRPAAFREGWRFAGRILVLRFLVFAAFALLAGALAAPVYYMFFARQTGEAVALVFLGLGIFIPVSAVLFFTALYGPMFQVLYKVRVREALGLAFDLLTSRLSESLVMAALLFGILALFIIGLIFSIIFAGIPVAFLSIVLDNLQLAWPIYFLISIVGAGVLCAIVILGAGFAVFYNFAWALAVLEMVKTEKPDEPEKVLAPEAEPAA